MYTATKTISERINAPVKGEVRLLPKFFLFLTVLVLILSAVGPLGILFMLGVTFYALRGSKESIEALTMLAFMIVINKGLASVPLVSLFRWAILFAAFGRILWDSIMKDESFPSIMVPLMLFSSTVFLFSLMASQLPLVSVLKLISFAIGVGTIMIGLYRTMHLREYWVSFFLTLGVFILLASLPLYGSRLGFLRNGTGFQGIINHPQVYGSLAATTTSFLTGLVLFYGNRSRLILIALGIGWIGIFTSQSRTAFLALFTAFLLVLVGCLFNRSWFEKVSAAFTSLNSFFAMALLSVFLLLNWSSLQEGLTKFLLKDDGDTSVAASLEDSRGDLIQRSMDNFMSAPITGIGFGVPSDPRLTRIETGFLGLPIGASVEKGFMPSAVLEETGLAGALFVIMIIFALIIPVVKYGGIPLFWMLMTCFMINLGEMVFFSVGGMGLYLWLLIGFCYSYSIALSPKYYKNIRG